MNTNLSFAMNPATNESLVPSEMLRAGSATVRSVVDFMVLYGVDKLDVGRHMHGTISLISPRMRVMTNVDIPPWVEGSRKQAMLHLSHLMLIMGVLGIEVTLEPSEITTMVERWRSCERLSSVGGSEIDQVAQLLASEGDVKIEDQ
jgi:hypothetical protein